MSSESSESSGELEGTLANHVRRLRDKRAVSFVKALRNVRWYPC